MSDDEEVIYKKPQKSIHYGTLESNEWLQQSNTLEDIQSDEDDYEPEKKKPALSSNNSANLTTTTGNIHISSEYFDLEQEVYVLKVFFGK